VYEVRNKRTGKLYAAKFNKPIKVDLHTGDIDTLKEVKWYMNEIKTFKAIKCLYVVRFKEAFMGEDWQTIIVMHQIKGSTL